MNIIQTELHRAARNWSIHRIRPSNNAESPPGSPDVLYFNPETQGAHECLIPANTDEREVAAEICCAQPSPRGCSEEFNSLAEMIMTDEGLPMPRSADDAKNVYIALLGFIEEIRNDE